MPRVALRKPQGTEAAKRRRCPVVLGGARPEVADAPVAVAAAASQVTGFDLSAHLRSLSAGGFFAAARYWEDDPVAWVREKQVRVETKTHGLVPFEPWPFQEDLMRRVWRDEALIIDKSRQVGVSTSLCLAHTHGLLYRQELRGIPMHGHMIANKEEVALGRLLKTVKTALWHADLDDEQLERLGGYNPAYKNHEITYSTSAAQNYIMAHTSAASAGRSFDGNMILLDEYAYLAFAEEIWTNVVPMIEDLDHPAVYIVSTHNGADNHFCHLIDHAEEMGLRHLPIDWRARPGRDEAWKERSQRKFEGSRAQWEQEYELRRIKAGERALDMAELARHAGLLSWLGNEPLEHRRYVKGVDQAGAGSDKTVHTVVDLARASQVVYQKGFPKQSTVEKIASIRRLDDDWPGKLFIDCTNDSSLAALVGGRNVVAVRLSGGAKGSARVEKTDGVRWLVVPRKEMLSWGVAHLERGRLVVHREHFPDLWEGLDKLTMGHENEGGKVKRKGVNVDEVDSLLLASLGLPRRRERRRSGGDDGGGSGSGGERKWHGLPSSSSLRGLRGQRW